LFNVGLCTNTKSVKAGGRELFLRPPGRRARRAATQYEYPQGSACFIQSVDDTMEDIMRLAQSEAMLFKYGSGTGSDLSTLRSTREKLKRRRQAEWSPFLPAHLRPGRGTVKSGGKTRRAAKDEYAQGLPSDIEEFIEAKTKEEKKAWALIEAGYDGSYNGEAYGFDHVSERKPHRAGERRVSCMRRSKAASGGRSG